MDEDMHEGLRFHTHQTLEGLEEAGLSVEEAVTAGIVDVDDAAALNGIKRKREGGREGGARSQGVARALALQRLPLTTYPNPSPNPNPIPRLHGQLLPRT